MPGDRPPVELFEAEFLEGGVEFTFAGWIGRGEGIGHEQRQTRP
jgi:hypothetical protein